MIRKHDIIKQLKMKKKSEILIIIAAASLALLIPVIVFFTRSPVLIVCEQSFITLYGNARVSRQVIASSLSLFRQVKIVEVANDAGDDIIQYAVSDVSSKPFFVVFPKRFTRSALIYNQQNPEVRIVFLEGRYPETQENAGFFSYYTDIESDFYKAGYAAASLSVNNSGNIAVFIEPVQYRLYGMQARSAFQRGLDELDIRTQPYFYTSHSEIPVTLAVSCIVIAGAGWEYLENNANIPVILFSWLDPQMAPSNVVLVVDDSPFAQLLTVASLISARQEKGNIKSKFYLINTEKYENRLLRNINNM